MFMMAPPADFLGAHAGKLSPPALNQAVSFYVSPQANDRNPGTIDKPFATLARAQAAVRKTQQKHDGPITVWLREGTYYLTEPVVFHAEDSGKKNAPVTYKAYPHEQPVISGGFPLNLKWKSFQDEIMKASVPDSMREIDQLFVNGKRQHLARYPNFDPTARFFGGTAANAISAERVKTWSHPVGGYMHALQASMWGSKHYEIVGVDSMGNLKFRGGWQENRSGGFDPIYRGGYHKKYLFVENIFQELDHPGEWYFDYPNRILYCRPGVGVNLQTAEIIGAGLKQLIVIKGSAKEPVRHIHFEGVQFKHTQRIFMEPYERLLRGDWSIARLGAVLIEGAEHCSLRDCLFEDLGGNGVFLSCYNRRIHIEGCKFTRLGESCVCLVGDVGAVRNPAICYSNTIPQDQIDLTPGPKTPNYPAQCKIHNNLMHHFGYVGKQVAGVILSMAEEITVSHNTIYQCPRAAICINDGCWGGHIIEYNDAFNTVRESGDHGPFNSWGRDRWWKTENHSGRDVEPFAKERSRIDNYKITHIRNNRFAHPGGHSWGIDLDDGSSNYHVYQNLCLGMGVKLREGFYRVVENNIIVNGFGGFHIWMPDCEDVITRNIFVSDTPYQFIRANPEHARKFDLNVFYAEKGEPKITGVGKTMTLSQWQAKGFDTLSICADPMFVAPEKGDYQVKPGSPALKLGFKNFPMNQFGALKPAFQIEVARESRKFRPAPTQCPPSQTRTNRQISWLGATIKNLIGEAEKSAVGVGEETGVLLVSVPSNSRAEQVGLKTGDLIRKLNGKKVHSMQDLLRLLRENKGKNLTLVVFNAVERILVLPPGL